MKILPVILVGFMLAGSIFTSCKKDPVSPKPCDTCTKPCDTCNINQDSLTHIRDSVAHAFVWAEYINKIPGETNPTGVWLFSPNDIMICGNSLWHFDGTSFQMIDAIRNGSNTSLNFALNGCSIFAFSQTDFWLVDGGSALHTTDGHHFDDFRPGSDNACWGTSSNYIFIVGKGGSIYHFNGSRFDTMTSNTVKDLRSVWGTSSSDVWACGYNTSTGETILTHYDGQSWQEDNLSLTKGINATGGFNGVWAFDSAGHHFVATSGGILAHKMDNGGWKSDSGLIPNKESDGSFIGIGPRGGTTTDYFVIGPWGFVAHWNGKTWKQYTTLFDYSNNDYYSSGFSMLGNTACVIGVKNGQCWVAVGTRKP